MLEFKIMSLQIVDLPFFGLPCYQYEVSTVVLSVTNLHRRICWTHEVGSPLLTEFFHTQESEIKPLTTCLGSQSFLPLEPINY